MGAPDSKSKIPLWVKIGYFFLATLAVLAAYRYGSIWIGNIVLIVALFVATWFLQPKMRPLVRFALLILSSTLLVTTALFFLFETLVQANVVAGNDLLEELLANPLAAGILAFALALLVSTVFWGLSFLLAQEMSIEYILAMREVYGVTRKEARRLLSSIFFHFNYPYYVVEEGKITKTKPEGMLPKLGGPGKVVIRPYNAAVFERAGNTTRIEGPGTVITKRFELLKDIVDLRKQWMEFTALNVLTKDHVPLTLQCGVGFRIESRNDTVGRDRVVHESFEGSHFPGIISGDYPAYKRTIYKAVYGTTEARWKLTNQGATESTLREVMREYLFEELYRFEEEDLRQNQSVIDKVMAETRKRVNAISPSWGTAITSFVIKTIDVPADVKQRLLEFWGAEYARRRIRVIAQGEADALRTQTGAMEEALARLERVRSQALEGFVKQIDEGLGHGHIVGDAVIERFITAVERISRNIVRDGLGATRYVEMLEKFAESDGEKTLILGPDHAYLGPARTRQSETP